MTVKGEMVKLQYEAHKGKKAEYHGMTGVVCGYDMKLGLLIMAIDEDCRNVGQFRGHNYDKVNGLYEHRIKTHKHNTNGYLYVTKEDLVEIKVETKRTINGE